MNKSSGIDVSMVDPAATAFPVTAAVLFFWFMLILWCRRRQIRFKVLAWAGVPVFGAVSLAAAVKIPQVSLKANLIAYSILYVLYFILFFVISYFTFGSPFPSFPRFLDWRSSADPISRETAAKAAAYILVRTAFLYGLIAAFFSLYDSSAHCFRLHTGAVPFTPGSLELTYDYWGMLRNSFERDADFAAVLSVIGLILMEKTLDWSLSRNFEA